MMEDPADETLAQELRGRLWPAAGIDAFQAGFQRKPERPPQKTQDGRRHHRGGARQASHH